MLAHHPLTGQPIKIMRTGPPLHADNKTLVWIRGSFTAGSWARWFTVVSDISGVAVVGDVSKITAIVLTKDSPVEEWLPVLPTIMTESSGTLLVAPARVLDLLSHRGFKRAANVVTTEDLYDSYPFLGSALTAEDDVATVVCALAHILRMNRIAWHLPENYGNKARRGIVTAAWQRLLEGRFLELDAAASDSIVPRTWLIQQYFHHKTTRRAREIFSCLEKNIESPFIDHIILLNEQEYSEIPASSKVTVLNHPHRMTYYDVLKTALERVPAGDIVVFSNSDIYFDESLLNLWRLQIEERRMFLALLRWEGSTIFGPRADSQDTWICARNSLDWTLDRSEFDFPFGKPGCDNVITYLMMKHRMLIVNPAYTIITHHLHSSNVRNYDPKDVLYRPIYVYVEPVAIQSLSLCTRFDTKLPEGVNKELTTHMGDSFTRVIEGVEDTHVNTCVSMLQHGGHNGYVHGGSNLYTPSCLFPGLYHCKEGAFATVSGLVYTFTKMWGGNKAWETLWNESNVDSLTPAVYVPKLLVYPTDSSVVNNLGAWVLHYLPRVALLRKVLAKRGIVAEFLVPQTQYIGDFLNDCVWDGKNITVVPMMTDMNYYSDDMWVVPPTDTVVSPVTREDVQLLRSIMNKTDEKGGIEKKEEPVVTFCVSDNEDDVCNRTWADSVAEHIFGSGWRVQYVSDTTSPVALRRAFSVSAWIVGSGASLDFMWFAPEKTRVMEFQRVDTPTDVHIHLAGACGHTYILGGLVREPLPVARQNAMLAVGKAIQKYGFKETLDATRATKRVEKPTIVMPAGTGLNGIFHHVGDTFREMVMLWKERGYIHVNTSEDTHYCWWDGVGGILLYDRPTVRWWNSDVPYQMALFGNCAPPGPETQRIKQSVWSFWGRSPRALERVSETSNNLRGYDSRAVASLFLGKVENGVQRAARTGADWKTAVDLFSMPFDSTGAPYPFTQDQYLEKLCNARFGLCLPGFGPKCNREIEYFACGCVPIVTPGVDMKGYLVPPLEGIHYFRASTPGEVQRLVKDTKPEIWARMSAAGRSWWRTYASVEGFFRLTWARIEQCRPYFAVGIPQEFRL